MSAIVQYLTYSTALLGATVLGGIARSQWTGETVSLDEWDLGWPFVAVAIFYAILRAMDGRAMTALRHLDPWRWSLIAEHSTPSEYNRHEQCRWTEERRIVTYMTGEKP